MGMERMTAGRRNESKGISEKIGLVLGGFHEI